MKKTWLFIVVPSVFFGLIYLGKWQWERGEAKAAVLQTQKLAKQVRMKKSCQQQKKTDAINSNHLSLTSSASDLACAKQADLAKQDEQLLLRSHSKKLAWHWVQLHGHFDAKHSLLWENKFRNHQVGFEVLTPFYLDCGQVQNLNQENDRELGKCHRILLVNRGWVSMKTKTSREGLESLIDKPSNSTMVTGQLVWPEQGVLLGENLGQGWPKSMQAWVLPELKALFHVEMLPYMLRLSTNGGEQFDRTWSQPRMSPERHRMYAYQWWLFAAVWAIGVIMLIRREKDA